MIKFKGCLLVLLILVLLNDNQTNAHSKESDLDHHTHDHVSHHHDHHDHNHENSESPHYKYSREANEKYFKHQVSDEPEVKHLNRQSKEIWLGAIGSTLLISIVPYLVLIFIPINSPHEHQSLLKVLLSFASGGLLGDAFLHLIPHALVAQQELEQKHSGHHHHHSHGHSHAHSHDSEHPHSHDMSVGLCVLSGILVFLMIEKFVRIVKGSHHHHHAFDHQIDEKEEENELIEENDEQDKVDKVDNELDKEKVKGSEKGNQKKVRFDENLEIYHIEKLSNGTNN